MQLGFFLLFIGANLNGFYPAVAMKALAELLYGILY